MMQFRICQARDLVAMQAIYAHSVINTAANYEYEVPDLPAFSARINELIADGFPVYVADDCGVVAGYAYYGFYNKRAGFRFLVENTVYISPNHHRKGIGRGLMEIMIDLATKAGYRQMMAKIGDAANHAASIGLHKALGFVVVGTLPASGYKFGAWRDTVFMQRSLGDGALRLPDQG